MSAKRVYLALAVVTAVTVFVEIVITRVFSLTLWYHFGFLAISLAMLGMAGGAMYVYLRRGRYEGAESIARMSRLIVWFALAIVAAYIFNLGIAFTPSFHPAALVSLGLIVGSWGVPFFLSGMIVAIALTRTSLPVGRMYAADLIGAALGCLAVQPALAHLGPPAGLAAAAIVLVLVAVWLGQGLDWPDSVPRLRTRGVLVLLAVLALASAVRPGLLAPRWVKGRWDHAAEKTYWNAISRVAIWPPETQEGVFGWGFGSKLQPDRYPPVTFRVAETDAFIRTWFIEFDGDFDKHRYVDYDVVNVPYHLRPGGAAAIIGSGAGLDILAALTMGQRHVTGIELNPVLVRLLREDYAEFTGNIAHDPRVQLVADEARNWIERCGERFDVIQTTFTDTQAATGAGAFALAENTLYTTEAWRAYLEHLTPDGLFSISRWHWSQDPMETYRLTTVARAALCSIGQPDPGKCMALIANIQPDNALRKVTVVVSPSPLSGDDCRGLDEAAERYGFEILYSPTSRNDPYATLLDPARAGAWEADYHLNITPPTDDRAYFFFMVRARDLLAPGKWREMWRNTHFPMHMSVLAVFTFAFLGVALTIAAIGLTLAPLYAREGRGAWKREDFLPTVYFAAIGVGFIMLELAIMQRTGIVLGHPIYALEVTLFGLLLGSGVGSLLSSSLGGKLGIRARVLLLATVAATAATALAVGPLSAWLSGAPQTTRIACVAALVFCVGLFMGAPFPTGLAVARARGRNDMLPWMWGVNGVCSVIGAFVATGLGIMAGARVTGLVGAAMYVLALAAIWVYTGSGRMDGDGSDEPPEGPPEPQTPDTGVHRGEVGPSQ